ncbi:MAG: universal stress protein, partial [Solirubrobacteraceae bacterium]|nr:universal stress protein [Solirubrobacteraceae bacterium]
MDGPTTIVAGVGFGDSSRAAVATARALAEALGARLVLAPAYPYDLLPLEGVVVEVQVSERMHAEAQERVRAVRDELAPGAEIRVLPDTSPARALHEVCEDERAGLLVLGAAGEIGTAALHHAPCPVLVGAAPPPWATVGVGVDGSPESRHAEALAQRLARAAGARLVRLTVVGEHRQAPPSVDGAEVLEGWPAEALAARSAELD